MDKKYIAADYMKRDVVTIPVSATVKEALDLMLKKGTNGLVVIDAEKHVKGIVTSLDIIRFFVPDYLETDMQLASFEAADLFKARAKEIANEPILKFMTKDVKTITENVSMIQVATMLTENKMRQLPVVDESNILVGYINRTDVKRAMGDVLNNN